MAGPPEKLDQKIQQAHTLLRAAYEQIILATDPKTLTLTPEIFKDATLVRLQVQCARLRLFADDWKRK
jgi:hypothetical protein